MRWRLRLFAATLGAALFGVLSVLPMGSRTAQVQADATNTVPSFLGANTPGRSNDKWQGAGSCASSACHGAPGPAGHWETAYLTWATVDPHTKAYDVLFNETSERIAKNLKSNKKAHEMEECLICHVGVSQQERNPRLAVEDGVGCEMCHGPARDWLALHTAAEWKGKSTAEKAEHGMWNTKDIGERAKRCSVCHVGAGDRDVNHNLIAAGHPRLYFEFGAFHANYPKHWNHAAEKSQAKDLEAKLWIAGQKASAVAALELLEARAKKENGQMWPEFAEYDCFACHHSLREPTWRQSGHLAPGLRPGQLPRADWYTALLPVVLPTMSLDGKESDLAKLNGLLGSARPDRTAVAALAAKIRHQIQSSPSAPGDLGALGARLLAAQSPALEQRWDVAVQRYLGLAALEDAQLDLLGSGREKERAEQRKRLNQALELLKSPMDFKPTAVGPLFESLKQR